MSSKWTHFGYRAIGLRLGEAMLNELHPAQDEAPFASKFVRTISVRLIHPKNERN